MEDTSDVWPRGVDGSVQAEACGVDAEVSRARVDDLPSHIDLDKTRRRHLVIHHAIGNDEEVFQLLVDACLRQRGNMLQRCEVFQLLVDACLRQRGNMLQ